MLADLRHDMVQTVNLMLEGLDAAALERRMQAAGRDASGVIAGSGIAVERIDELYELDMHYLGRPTRWPCRCRYRKATVLASPRAWSAPRSRRPISRRSAASCPASRCASCRFRVAAIGRRPAFDFSVFAPDPSASLDRARSGSRPVWFDGGWRDTGVWARLDLPVNAKIAGPAILEQPDATTVIEPGLAGRIDKLGNLIVEPA